MPSVDSIGDLNNGFHWWNPVGFSDDVDDPPDIFLFFRGDPVGWIARLLGQDFLSLKLDHQARSYWRKKKSIKRTQPGDYEQQY